MTLHAHVGDNQRVGPGLPTGTWLCHNQLVLPRPVGSAAAAAAAAPRFKELHATHLTLTLTLTLTLALALTLM